jgi:hypothetical protein
MVYVELAFYFWFLAGVIAGAIYDGNGHKGIKWHVWGFFRYGPLAFSLKYRARICGECFLLPSVPYRQECDDPDYNEAVDDLNRRIKDGLKEKERKNK